MLRCRVESLTLGRMGDCCAKYRTEDDTVSQEHFRSAGWLVRSFETGDFQKAVESYISSW